MNACQQLKLRTMVPWWLGGFWGDVVSPENIRAAVHVKRELYLGVVFYRWHLVHMELHLNWLMWLGPQPAAHGGLPINCRLTCQQPIELIKTQLGHNCYHVVRLLC